jgi:hypothetical protein
MMTASAASDPRTNAALDPVAVFRARAEARALLWKVGELDLHEAVDGLQADAERDGIVAVIGQDRVQSLLCAAFHCVARP